MTDIQLFWVYMILDDVWPIRTLDELNGQTERAGNGLPLRHPLPRNTEPWPWLFAWFGLVVLWIKIEVLNMYICTDWKKRNIVTVGFDMDKTNINIQVTYFLPPDAKVNRFTLGWHRMMLTFIIKLHIDFVRYIQV